MLRAKVLFDVHSLPSHCLWLSQYAESWDFAFAFVALLSFFGSGAFLLCYVSRRFSGMWRIEGLATYLFLLAATCFFSSISILSAPAPNGDLIFSSCAARRLLDSLVSPFWAMSFFSVGFFVALAMQMNRSPHRQRRLRGKSNPCSRSMQNSSTSWLGLK